MVGLFAAQAGCGPLYLPARPVAALVPATEPTPPGAPAALVRECRLLDTATTIRHHGDGWFCFAPPAVRIYDAQAPGILSLGQPPDWESCRTPGKRMTLAFAVMTNADAPGGATARLQTPSATASVPADLQDRVLRVGPDGRLIEPPRLPAQQTQVKTLTFDFDVPCEVAARYRLALWDRGGLPIIDSDFEPVTWTTSGHWAFIGE